MIRSGLVVMLLTLCAGATYAEHRYAQHSQVQSSQAQGSQVQSRQQYFSNMDSDSNGGVSLAEFQVWMAYSFNRIDKNLNNVIDADEALVPKMAGVTRAQHQANIAAQFRRQDRNRSGELSMMELTAPPQ